MSDYLNNEKDKNNEIRKDTVISTIKQYVADRYLGGTNVNFDSFINEDIDETNSDVYVVEPWCNDSNLKDYMQQDVEDLLHLVQKIKEIK